MTAETINVPAQTAAGPPDDVQPARPRAAPVGGLWRRAWWRSALVPLTVLTPIVALAPTADHRYNIYWHGGLFRDNPLSIVTQTWESLPSYLGMGNFRPLGRMLEKALDLVAFMLGDLLGLPAGVAFRLVSFVAAIVLTMTAVVFAESVVARGRLFRQAPSTLAAVVPFAVGAGFIAAGSASPVVLFGGLYLLSAAVIFVVAAATCRAGYERRRLGWWRIALLLVAGAALACFNEITYLALPLATVAVLIRGRVVLGLAARQVLTGRPARILALLWLGFLPVFLTIRVIIYGYCSQGGCYRNSDIVLGPDVLRAEPARLVAWLPPLMWRTAVDGRPWLIGLVPLAALVVLAVLAVLALRDLPQLSVVDRRQAAALTVSALTLLILGATMAALNGEVQTIVAQQRWGQGWRETSFTAAAGALLLVAAAHLVRARRVVAVALIVVFVLTGAASAAANKRFAETLSSRQPAMLTNRIAQEMADFDDSSTGDLRRCALRTEFRVMYADYAFSLRRFDQALNKGSRQLAGVPFCSEAP